MPAAPTGPEPQGSRPTMADVGRLAGVSPTTVSLVINHRSAGEISEPTRKRVLDAVETLGYRPNRTARGLRTRRTHTVGFVIDEIGVMTAGGPIISGAHDLAWEHGSLLIVVTGTRTPRVLQAAVEDLLDRQVDALIFAVAGTRRAAPPAAVSQLPTVLVNCFAPQAGIPCVLPAEAAGGRAGTELLLAAGHRRVAYITGPPGSWATRQRLKGYRAALTAAGVAYDCDLVLAGSFRADSGYERTRELLRRPDPPTAIFCGNDRMALGAYLALGEAGLRVPADVSVVGYDDQESLAPEVHPALSTVHLPYYEMGRWAAEQLVHSRIELLPPRTYIPCPVVARASVAPPPARPAANTRTHLRAVPRQATGA